MRWKLVALLIGDSATQTLSDDPQRAAAGDSAGNVFKFAQREYAARTVTDSRNDPSVTRQQKMNGVLVFAERSTDRI